MYKKDSRTKIYRKTLALVLVFVLGATGSIGSVYGATKPVPPTNDVVVSLRSDISVEMGGAVLAFEDAKGKAVYPLMYNGRPYLPLRAMANLIGEPVEWIGESNIVCIGQTFSSPSKVISKSESLVGVKVVSAGGLGVTAPDRAKLREDIIILYDFAQKKFSDGSGKVVLPLTCRDSTYLPMWVVSDLIKRDIRLDEVNKKIHIGTEAVGLGSGAVLSSETKQLIELYDREAKLYNDAIWKIRGLSTVPAKEIPALAKDVTGYYRLSQSYSAEVKTFVNRGGLTSSEKAVGEKLLAFCNMCEYYILVMENITYMASQGQDYSGLSETFLNFAMETQTTMDEARKAIELLKQ